MTTTAVRKLWVLCLANLLVLQACAVHDPNPSGGAGPRATADGFLVRLDSLSISEGPSRRAMLKLTMWNTTKDQMTLEASDITVVDSEGQSATTAAQLYVVDQKKVEGAAGVAGGIVACVVFSLVCLALIPVVTIREANRHRPAVVVRAGGDETVSVSLAEYPVRFDMLSLVRVRRPNSEQVVELPITRPASLPK